MVLAFVSRISQQLDLEVTTKKGIGKNMVLSHFQPMQPNALRHLKTKQSGTQSTQWSSTKKLARALSTSVVQVVSKFGQRSTIHGMNRVVDEHSGKYEKLIWLCTLVLAFCGSIYVCHLLSNRFNEGKFETVVDSTREPVYHIYFPVVTICNQNRLNWQRLEEAKRRFLPNEKSEVNLDLFERVIGAYDDVEFGNFNKFAVLEESPLHLLQHVNFSLVFEFMTWRCEEFLTSCVWNHDPQNCCEIFSRRRSKSGYCWAFNTLETVEGLRMQRLDPLWPWHTGSAGPTTGLMVRALINPEKHYPGRVNKKGISVMITEPNVWHKDPFFIPEKTQTILEIEPVIYFYDNDTRSVSSNQRQCVFDDERNSEDFKSLQGYVYMIENCQSECHQEYLMRYCNCSMDLMFPPGSYPACRAPDLLCLAKNNDRFLYSHQPGEERYVRNRHQGMVCKCFRNCNSLNYVCDVRPSYLPAEMLSGNNSYVDLDVHYRFDSLMVYRTRLVFGWIDLLVAFGGIAGLFLGCSLISAMELIYFGLIELPSFAFSDIKFNWRQQQQQPPNIKPLTNNKNMQNRIIPGNYGNYGYNLKTSQNYGRLAALNYLNSLSSTKSNYPNIL